MARGPHVLSQVPTLPITALLYSVSARLSAKYTVSHAYLVLTESSWGGCGVVGVVGVEVEVKLCGDWCRGSSRVF